MDAFKTHISISCDVYPELFAKLKAIGNPHKRAELLKTLAEDGRRWRDGIYANTPPSSPAEAVNPGVNRDGNQHDDGFKLPALALEDAKDIGW